VPHITQDKLTNALTRLEGLITKPAESPEDREQGLWRSRHLLAQLGDPQRQMDLIHIGGTSGKGSVTMICEAILGEHGFRVGVHTSPYLQTPLEKSRVDGMLIGAEETIRLTDEIMQAVENVAASTDLEKSHYAEAWLGIALRHFVERECKTGVIEVGMGGRFDSTNVIGPKVSVINSVHYDHVRVLGETLEEIAWHKAGIIKQGVPCVVGEMTPQALRVIEEEAKQAPTRLIKVGRDVTYQLHSTSVSGTTFDYQGIGLAIDTLRVGLLGAHQAANASAALAAVELYAAETGLALNEEAIRRGLSTTRFAGRLEVVQGNPTVVLDGAHNEEKIGALTKALTNVFDYERLIVVTGMIHTKDVKPAVNMLAQVSDVLVATELSVKKKPAYPASALASAVSSDSACEVYIDSDPQQALDYALRLADQNDLVVVTGSLFLVGAMRERWYRTEEIVRTGSSFGRVEVL